VNALVELLADEFSVQEVWHNGRLKGALGIEEFRHRGALRETVDWFRPCGLF
jgi:hypothetical protein